MARTSIYAQIITEIAFLFLSLWCYINLCKYSYFSERLIVLIINFCLGSNYILVANNLGTSRRIAKHSTAHKQVSYILISDVIILRAYFCN